MRRFPRYPATMALALALAAVVWYTKALDRRERISEKQVEASVTLVNVPPEMVITSEVPASLVLRVRGPLSRLRGLDPSQTGVVIDLRGAGEGEHEFTVETRNVVVPDGIEVLVVSPSQVPLRLERMVQRHIPVRPRLVGEPVKGMVVGKVDTEPGAVLVSGPRLQLESVRNLTTDPVSLDGAEGPVAALVTVRCPLPLARILEPLAVRVLVDITARPEPPSRKRR
jgi:YbbR domain-containing protein